ncbi:hypothetical protein [Rhizorhabdus argentea]|uniref:hypothetical protein n=1 Tax=Rhizorhabdus argentea TaxID=1387174 RepID=UPI0030ED21ED
MRVDLSPKCARDDSSLNRILVAAGIGAAVAMIFGIAEASGATTRRADIAHAALGARTGIKPYLEAADVVAGEALRANARTKLRNKDHICQSSPSS